MNKLHDEVYTAICNSHHGGGAPPCYRCGDAVSTLDRMGLLATPEMRETMKCLSPKADAAVSMSGGLVGVRLGIESDFVTPAMLQAVEIARAYRRDGYAFDPHGKVPAHVIRAMNALDDIGAKLLAEEAERAPKPRWLASPFGDKWGVLRDNESWWTGFTEQQARAVAERLNELERGK